MAKPSLWIMYADYVPVYATILAEYLDQLAAVLNALTNEDNTYIDPQVPVYVLDSCVSQNALALYKLGIDVDNTYIDFSLEQL